MRPQAEARRGLQAATEKRQGKSSEGAGPWHRGLGLLASVAVEDALPVTLNHPACGPVS